MLQDHEEAGDARAEGAGGARPLHGGSEGHQGPQPDGQPGGCITASLHHCSTVFLYLAISNFCITLPSIARRTTLYCNSYRVSLYYTCAADQPALWTLRLPPGHQGVEGGLGGPQAAHRPGHLRDQLHPQHPLPPRGLLRPHQGVPGQGELHLLTFSPSHLLIFSSSHLLILSSSHLLTRPPTMWWSKLISGSTRL